MQIVIDIPEDVYTRLFDNGIQDNEIVVDDVCEMARAIRLGTPLPKGHGRLGDLDELETYFKNVRRELKPADYKYAVEYFTRDNMLLNAEQFIHLMDAIIPADEDGDLL